MPFFSIIIPTYNSEKTLKVALKSILSQSYYDYEILIIDGASKDKTLEFIKMFALADKRIRWISDKDNGVYDAMNKGINIAKGKWLFFLGSDDYLFEENVLAKVYDSISAHQGVDIIYGNVTSTYLGEKYDGFFDSMKITHKNICHQAIFYKKAIFDLLGGYNLKYKVNSDWEFNIRCFFSDKIKIEYVDLIISYFSGGGLSNTVEDSVFSAERNYIIAYNGYHSLSLKQLKFFCKSNLEFFQFLLRRVANYFNSGVK